MESTRSRGDRYALSAPRNKRASIVSDIVLVHVDATLRTPRLFH